MFHRTRGNNLHALASSFLLVSKHRRIKSGLIVQVSVIQKSIQYGEKLAVKIFQKLVRNARANIFPKMRDRISKQFSFYRCIIVDTCDLNAGR